MTLAICAPAAAAAGTVHQLEIVLRELDALITRIADAGAAAGPLAAGTDWQADAARAFHTAADAWAGDVRALAEVARTARDETRRARDRIALTAWAWCS